MSKLDNIQTVCDNCEYAPALSDTCKQRIKDLMNELVGEEKDYDIEGADDKQSQGYNQAIHELITVLKQRIAEL